jgi:hypothetical protein
MDLIDKDTPRSAMVKTGMGRVNNENWNLQWSDEFDVDGRSFYPGDDPFWEAVSTYFLQVKRTSHRSLFLRSTSMLMVLATTSGIALLPSQQREAHSSSLPLSKRLTISTFNQDMSLLGTKCAIQEATLKLP